MQQTPRLRHSNRRFKSFGFALAFLGSALVWLSACGKGFNEPMQMSEEARAKLPMEPVEKTYPSLPAKHQPKDKAYGIYQVLDAKVGADLSRNEISARVLLKSTAGDETVELLGKIRQDGSATLVDINPLFDNKYRLTAEAFCVDKKECKKIIVNIVYKVGTKEVRKQFVTKPLVQEAPGQQPNASQPAPAKQNSPSHGAPGSVSQSEPHDVHDEYDEDSDDPDSELSGVNQLGEYVGAQPPQEIIQKLWERPEDPKPEDLSKSEPVANSPYGPITIEPLPPQAHEPLDKDDNADDDAKEDPGVMPVPGGYNGGDKTKSSKPAPSAQSPNGSGSGFTSNPVPTSEKQPEAGNPPQKIPIPGRKPSPPPLKEDKNSVETEDIPVPGNKPQPPPYTATAPDVKQDSISEFEYKIAPLMNIIEGGRAIGPHMTTRNDDGSIEKGSIEDADELPDQGKGFRKIYPQRDRDFGTGMLVSLIENASAYYVEKYYPEAVVIVGDLAQETGGPLRNSRHKSHQSGLDIDIPYIGTFKFESVVSSSKLKTNFEYAKNWQYFRLIASQQIKSSGVQQTVLSRIFVGPTVKKGFCAWAKKTGIINNSFDADILRRLRPESGHDDHFHVRLKCSPYYPACRNQVEPPGGTGC